jgi:hypothetical protein
MGKRRGDYASAIAVSSFDESASSLAVPLLNRFVPLPLWVATTHTDHSE